MIKINWNAILPKDGCYVYRYTDMKDGIIKYVGIVTKGKLPNRHRDHMRDYWYRDGEFLLEYITVANKSEAEAIESHLISLYQTDQWYNIAKAGWGLVSYFPTKFDWKIVVPSIDNILDEIKVTFEVAKEVELKRFHPSFFKNIKDTFQYCLDVENYIKEKNRRPIREISEAEKDCAQKFNLKTLGDTEIGQHFYLLNNLIHSDKRLFVKTRKLNDSYAKFKNVKNERGEPFRYEEQEFVVPKSKFIEVEALINQIKKESYKNYELTGHVKPN